MLNLRHNNDRNWFEEHKNQYKSVLQKPMQELAEETYRRFIKNIHDLNLKLHIARIHRDARRPNIFGPYKDHLWFTIRQQEEVGRISLRSGLSLHRKAGHMALDITVPNQSLWKSCVLVLIPIRNQYKI